MGAAKVLQTISFDQYLLIEQKAQVKHELVNGVMYAMAGTSSNHNLITTNLLGLLWMKVRGSSCWVYSRDMKVKLSTSRLYFGYRDERKPQPANSGIAPEG